ncbi:MAG: carbamoyl-phosphate synthase large subunit [Chloroflexota bacterium]|nr:carbamoyl-phosphate synthase large subunit [Chloroflexota bacterium]MDQ5866122.1 carbamoyl-phosphate synthase large subunit [Chloroflexota bacterium]
MPKDPSIRKVLVIGSGPIVIGQAAEFDYAGTQACIAVREEGVEVVLVNSNPATIQTDPHTADRVYIEPLTVESLRDIIEKERPDGLIATMGGQTALNLAVDLERAGVLAEFGVRTLGTSTATIRTAEDRQMFADLMMATGQPVLAHASVSDLWQARDFAARRGFPLVVRAAFCLGGTGSGHANDETELEELVTTGLHESPVSSVLLERSVSGWAEIEYEVLRDADDNAIIVCNMENMDPMGIHTGESIVVAPSQTLSDEDYQRLRTASLNIVRSLGVVGGCNCQFALNQQTGEFAIIEVNPRLSRSSALASKATGYPIARVAAKIALGYTLAELRNEITGASACAEPALDYVVVKLPRWPFDKFRNVDRRLGMTMKSTGEVMAIGRTFEQAFLKALRSLDVGSAWLKVTPAWTEEKIADCLAHATPERPAAIYNAIARGWSIERIASLSHIHPWFITRLAAIYEMERRYRESPTDGTLRRAKRMGFSDDHLLALEGGVHMSEYERLQKSLELRRRVRDLGVRPTYKMVDTCAGEFAATTPYFYSTYEHEDEAEPLAGPKVIVLGSGPIRIGQGIEFDYSSVHAVEALRAAGIKAIVINNNPETVSTDFHLSDRLYFEPLTVEEVLNVVEHERDGLLGVIAQFGGQTALNLINPLVAAGVNILGTSPESISIAEDRDKMARLCEQLGIPAPKWAIAHSHTELASFAPEIGFPVLVRPSYVLGGRGMRVVHNEEDLQAYLGGLGEQLRKHPVLVDQFLQDATEIDVDAVSDGVNVFTVVMEQLERAGIHSGDSTCVYPPQSLSAEVISQVESYTRALARHLNVVGLMNVQYAVKDGTVYLLEVNTRASRTVPFASKATGLPLARIATQAIMGTPLSETELDQKRATGKVSVKAVVLPFKKFPTLVPVLGPEMQSTGETMGIAPDFATALRKARLGAGYGPDAPTEMGKHPLSNTAVRQ